MKTKYIKISFAFVFLFQVTYLFSQQTQDTAKKVAPIIPIVKLSDNITVKFGGFVRAEYYLDSRKTQGAVDDLFSFFPYAESKDAKGKDQNAVVRQNLSTQATRFNALFSGPDVLSAKSSAFFEFDFSGGAATNGTTTNPVGLRLRHAYIKLNWKSSELLIGKTWNPLGDIIFPSVVGLNTGIPFRPFGRGDQLRFTYKPTESISILAAALYQSEHKSFSYSDATGTTTANTNDIRINPVPDFHLQIHYKSGAIFAGLVSEYKIVRPATALKALKGTAPLGTYNTDETVSSYAFGGFAKYSQGLFTVQASGLYGQNLSELFQQGGYAVTAIDSTNGSRRYTPSNSITSWLNITYGKTVVIGLFGGYSKNLGFSKNIIGGVGSYLGRWQDVDHIYRISPSIKYNIGRLILGAELEYNVAAYGTVDYTNKGKVKDAKEVSGVRGLLAATFLF